MAQDHAMAWLVTRNVREKKLHWNVREKIALHAASHRHLDFLQLKDSGKNDKWGLYLIEKTKKNFLLIYKRKFSFTSSNTSYMKLYLKNISHFMILGSYKAFIYK